MCYNLLHVVEAFDIKDLEDAFEPASLSSPAIVCIFNCMHTTESLVQAVGTDVNDAALRWCGVRLAYFDATGARPSILDVGWMIALSDSLYSTGAFIRAVFP